MWFAAVGPSAVRSPREPVAPRALTEAEVDDVVEGFAVSAGHAAQAGFQVVELHAAHGYLLAQFLSPVSNLRSGAESAGGRAAIVIRIVEAIRATAPGVVVGIRLSLEGGEEAGLTEELLAELLPELEPSVDYLNLTVGVRTTYVKDMATEAPPLLENIAEIRPLLHRPLIVSQAFRRGDQIERALSCGADLVGMARPLIADPDFPIKLLSGREARIRPCVSCNEDCRAFDPQLLCSVNPTLAPPGQAHRPAKPLVVARGQASGEGPVAIVGAGPAGLECATALAGSREVVLFDERAAIGGELAVAAAAPHRHGWQALLEFYESALTDAAEVSLRLGTRVRGSELDGFDEVVIAVGSDEVRPALPGSERAWLSSAAIAAGPDRIDRGSHVLVVDDGFGSWRTASAVELAIAAGARRITLATPGAAFGASLPAEGRAQLLPRLRGAPLEVRPFTALVSIDAEAADVRNVMSGAVEAVAADTVIVVGERRPRDWRALTPEGAAVHAIGDAVVPRRVGPAISEGHALAVALAATATRHELGAPV
jgi:2,4-dienoyl-CoA reductase (NADPH2)